MRNPERLDNFYAEVCKIHKEKFPDCRFGQFISNFFGWIFSKKKKDIFFPEEDDMLKYLHEYVEVLK